MPQLPTEPGLKLVMPSVKLIKIMENKLSVAKQTAGFWRFCIVLNCNWVHLLLLRLKRRNYCLKLSIQGKLRHRGGWGKKKSKLRSFSKYWRHNQQVFKCVIYKGSDSNEIRHFKKSAKCWGHNNLWRILKAFSHSYYSSSSLLQFYLFCFVFVVVLMAQLPVSSDYFKINEVH